LREIKDMEKQEKAKIVITKDYLSRLADGLEPMPEMLPIVGINIFPNNINNKPEFKHIGADRITINFRIGDGTHYCSTGLDRGNITDEDMDRLRESLKELINHYYANPYFYVATSPFVVSK
jgi:hypothetical protein